MLDLLVTIFVAFCSAFVGAYLGCRYQQMDIEELIKKTKEEK